MEICKARIQDVERDVHNGEGIMKSVGILDRMSQFVAATHSRAEGERTFSTIAELQRIMQESGFMQEAAGEALDSALGASDEPAAVELEINQIIAEAQAKQGHVGAGTVRHGAGMGVTTTAAVAPASQSLAAMPAGAGGGWDGFDAASRGI